MKIYGQVLSREQMARLRELGVDTSDASMVWVKLKWGWDLHVKDSRHYKTTMALGQVEDCCPTYTIGDLIEKLPIEIKSEGMMIIANPKTFPITSFDICIMDCKMDVKHFSGDTLKDALYNLLCWVAKNHKELTK